MPLHGIKHKLRYIDLHSNCVDSIHHLLQCVVGLHFLTNLTLEKDGQDNPVCRVPGRAALQLRRPARMVCLKLYSCCLWI